MFVYFSIGKKKAPNTSRTTNARSVFDVTGARRGRDWFVRSSSSLGRPTTSSVDRRPPPRVPGTRVALATAVTCARARYHIPGAPPSQGYRLRGVSSRHTPHVRVLHPPASVPNAPPYTTTTTTTYPTSLPLRTISLRARLLRVSSDRRRRDTTIAFSCGGGDGACVRARPVPVVVVIPMRVDGGESGGGGGGGSQQVSSAAGTNSGGGGGGSSSSDLYARA